MITPMDIHNKEFEKGFRGYSEKEVNTFLAELAADYETFYRENRELKETIEHLNKRIVQYEQMEATMNNTLVLAQETAENVKGAARKEADLILQEAETQKRNMLEETRQALRAAQERHAQIRSDVAVFKAKMESILNSELQLLEGCVIEPCPTDLNDFMGIAPEATEEVVLDWLKVDDGAPTAEEVEELVESVAEAAAEDSDVLRNE